MSQPVVIVGAGPVGLMLACELGLAGVDTVVLERSREAGPRALGSAINATVIELLDQRGLMDALWDEGFELPRAHFAHVWLDPTRMAEEHPFNFLISHVTVARRLEEQAVKLGADVRYGAEVVGLAQDEDGITVTVRSGGGEHTVAGSYVVGCDGRDSAVRALAGIDFPGTDIRFHGITGDLEAGVEDPIVERVGITQGGTGFFTLAPSGAGTFRVTTGEFDVEAEDPSAPVTFEELSESVRRVTGVALGAASTPWLVRWSAATRQAERYQAGRVLLAGDAAHVHFPLGGQALSTGIEDAVNLGWKLAAVLRGGAPDGLLGTYTIERRPVGARACLTNRAQMALLHPMSTVEPLREILAELTRFDDVNEYLVRMAAGLDVRYDLGAGHPLLGRRLPEVTVRTADGETTVARLLHGGRGVLLALSGNATHNGPIRDAAAAWADQVDVVVAGPVAQIDAPALLIRPDGRVAWAGGDGLTDALRAWFGRPA